MSAPDSLPDPGELTPSGLIIAEDDDGLAELIRDTLVPLGLPIERTRDGAATITAIQEHPRHLLLLDYSLPDLNADEVIERLSVLKNTPNFVIITGQGNERVAVAMMMMGAREYLIKDDGLLNRLLPTIDRIVHDIRIQNRLDRIESSHKESQRELDAIYEQSPSVMIVLNGDFRIHKANRAAEEVCGMDRIMLQGSCFCEALGCIHITPGQNACGTASSCAACAFRRYYQDTLSTGVPLRRMRASISAKNSKKTSNPKKPFEPMHFEVSTARIDLDDHRFVLLCLENITEQLKLETQLQQSQKMEAIGQLAGGVAHDFNNMLAATMMQLGLLEANPRLDSDVRVAVKELLREASHAANLTRQLLMFSRKSILQTKRLNLNTAIDDVLKMLRRIIGENINLQFRRAVDLPSIDADQGMMEQLLMNLSINARDAMPEGGNITISTQTRLLTPESCDGTLERRPGTFVALSLSDDGCGMDDYTLAHIFEPFFTTKEKGKGTGLGLSTVQGIVAQHNGWVEVESVRNEGTTFTVYLPACEGTADSSSPDKITGIRIPAKSRETILLVEDERNVRTMIRRNLTELGYQVVEATTGSEALVQYHTRRSAIDLLLTDMVMPEGMTGLELALKLRETQGNIPVIITSGYSPELVQNRLRPTDNIRYLAKPYGIEQLNSLIRDCLTPRAHGA